VANGDYLLRIDQLGIHNPWPGGIPQFYIGCAQIRVSGGGSGLSGGVSIPGHVKQTDPGYTANVRFPRISSQVDLIANKNGRSTTDLPPTPFPVALS
jgi:hypothetical protein